MTNNNPQDAAGMLDVASAMEPNTRQKLFLRYFTAILIDLVVLNLFAEYWQHVTIDAFSISLCVALLLQLLLKLTLHLEHIVADYFKARPGKLARYLRFFSAWLILFLSKFLILGVINFAFGADVSFTGPVHGVLAFIAVVTAMLVAEEAVVRFYQRLA